MSHRLIRPLIALSVAVSVSLTVAPSAAAAPVVAVPPEVTSALAGFGNNPEQAINTWTAWAAQQPMTTRGTNQNIDRADCRIDSSGVSSCTVYERNPPGKKWNRVGVTYTLANERTQVFKRDGKWVRNNYGASNNPITNSDRLYSYDYWTPWTTPGVQYDTSVGSDGWYTVQSQNPTVGDDEYPVLMVKVSPDGTRAQFLQQYQDGKVAALQSLTLKDVPRIKVPQSTKQRR